MSGQAAWTVRGVGDGVGGFDTFFASEVLTRFSGAELSRRSDAARLKLASGTLAVTCDAFTVDPAFFPGGDIGVLAVCGTANDLLTEGARPDWLVMSLVLDEGADQGVVRRVLDSVHAQATRSGATLVGGDTKTADSPHLPILVTLTGFGMVRRRGAALGFETVRAGDELVLTGPVGAHSMAVLSAREGLGFEHVVSSDCCDVGLTIGPLVMTSSRIRALRDATRGGLLGTLHELAAATQLTVDLDVNAVPVAHEVRMAAEMLGLNPLELTNEGCFVIAVDAGHAVELVKALRQDYGLADAAIIGKIRGRTEPLNGVVIHDGAESRVSVRVEELGIPRLC